MFGNIRLSVERDIYAPSLTVLERYLLKKVISLFPTLKKYGICYIGKLYASNKVFVIGMLYNPTMKDVIKTEELNAGFSKPSFA